MSPAEKGQRPQEPPLDDGLEALVEYLARRYHIGAGATNVAWEQLPEAERKVFLSRARQTLVAIHDGGYRISHAPDGEGDGSRVSLAVDADALKLRIDEAEHFLHAGEPLLAFNEVQLGLESWPESLRLRQLQGLALARSGATRRANSVLQALADEGVNDGETLGLLARTHKDIGLSARDPRDKLVHLTAAFRIYEKAYRESAERNRFDDAYYTGINAATLAMLLNDDQRARRLASEVREICLAGRLETGVSDAAAYWLQATLGEAALVLGDIGGAKSAYEAASRLAGHRYGDLASTRRQARLLLSHRGDEADWLCDALATPPVLIFSGHMVDAPDRYAPRFPPQMEERVRASVRATIDSVRPLAAYGSAACGSDILCLEEMIEAGGEIHVILPFPPAEFREVSVEVGAAGDWGGRFERVLAAADSVTVASDHRASGSVSAFEYANLILTGMGSLRAEGLGASVVGLAVWDGRPGDGAGGTASAVQLWQERGFRVEHVDLAVMSDQQVAAQPATADPGAELVTGGFSHEIKAMLFADAVGYSKLTEDQIPIFISSFLGSVGRLSEKSEHRPIHAETAGDGLYMVFSSVADAGHYALSLSDLVHTIDWVEEGLPADMDLRIALHCGPIFCGTDPVTGRRLFTGPHTSRTARIEPITPPGQVYASGAFAAAAAASGAKGLEFRYVGRTQLAKKYGALPLFHVRRPAPALTN